MPDESQPQRELKLAIPPNTLQEFEEAAELAGYSDVETFLSAKLEEAMADGSLTAFVRKKLDEEPPALSA